MSIMKLEVLARYYFPRVCERDAPILAWAASDISNFKEGITQRTFAPRNTNAGGINNHAVKARDWRPLKKVMTLAFEDLVPWFWGTSGTKMPFPDTIPRLKEYTRTYWLKWTPSPWKKTHTRFLNFQAIAHFVFEYWEPWGHYLGELEDQENDEELRVFVERILAVGILHRSALTNSIQERFPLRPVWVSVLADGMCQWGCRELFLASFIIH